MHLERLGTLRYLHGKTKKFINRHIQIPIRHNSESAFYGLCGVEEKDDLVLHVVFRGVGWIYNRREQSFGWADREVCVRIEKLTPYVNGKKHPIRFPGLYKMEWLVRFSEIDLSKSKEFKFLASRKLGRGN